MMDFTGHECPNCKNLFAENDDLVYCSKCGCPQHRDCWNELGHCVFEDKHDTPEQWQKPSPKAKKNTDDPTLFKCQRCGYSNPADVRLCLNCGLDIDVGEPTPGFKTKRPEPDKNTMYEDFPFVVNIDPLGGVPASTLINGVPAGDIALFVQSQSPYYISNFAKMSANNSKVNFNPSAFFLTGGWFIFRKMYALGVIIFSLFLTLYASIIAIYVKIVYPIFSKYKTASFDELMQALMDETTGRQQMILNIWTLLFALMILLMLFCGLFANRIYLNHTVKRILDINKNANNASDFKETLKTQGGINLKAASSALVCYILIYYFAIMYFS